MLYIEECGGYVKFYGPEFILLSIKDANFRSNTSSAI